MDKNQTSTSSNHGRPNIENEMTNQTSNTVEIDDECDEYDEYDNSLPTMENDDSLVL